MLLKRGNLSALNRSHPAAAQAVMCAVSTGGSMVDIVARQNGTITGAVSGVLDPIIGAATNVGASSKKVAFTGRPTKAYSNVTWAAVIRLNASPSTTHYICTDGASPGTNGSVLRFNTVSVNFRCNTDTVPISTVLVNGGVYFIAGSAVVAPSGSRSSLVVRRLDDGSGVLSSAGDVTAAMTPNGTLNCGLATVNFLPADIGWIFKSQSTLSLKELIAWAEDPWGIFDQSDEMLFWGALASAAPVSYTLAAVAGSYAITGVAAKLTATRALPANPGSYAVTGAAAKLAATRALAANPGSYAITGAAAKLAATRALSLSPGSYAITGAAANLTYTTSGATYTLPASPGSYLLSGVATGLAAQRKLSLAPGSYAITGAAAKLTATRALAAIAGAYAITGAAALFKATRTLSLAPGSYATTGSPAGLAAQRKLGANAGSYFVTGAAAALTKTSAYVLQANPGSYFIAGVGTNLIYSGAPTNLSDEYIIRARRTERR